MNDIKARMAKDRESRNDLEAALATDRCIQTNYPGNGGNVAALAALSPKATGPAPTSGQPTRGPASYPAPWQRHAHWHRFPPVKERSS